MSDKLPVIVILAMGEMGAGLAGLLTSNGIHVRTSVAGRGDKTAERGRCTGAAIFDDDVKMLEGADILLSIVPPSEALALANRLAPALSLVRNGLLYVDCNAVSPQTVAEIEKVVTATGARFADGGILGLAPVGGAKCPRIFVSGPHGERLRGLSAWGLDVRVMQAPVGAASALKCAYAAIGKGLIAVAAEAILAARTSGVERYLKTELSAYQPTIFAALQRDFPTLPAKSYRWVEEMRQIGTFLSTVNGGEETFFGCSSLFELLAGSDGKRDQASDAMSVLQDFILAP